MDKTNIVNTFTEVVDQLRNTECSQKEKITCFQRVSECIVSPVMAAHLNYATFCSKAVNILLLFCEDLDSVVRISAEENLNRIFRVLEKTKVSRILMDLVGEIKRNGNQRSLRICLRIFGYYAPQIREHNVLWYAQNLLPCMKVISKRKETLLQETLSEFVIKFGKHIQQGLTDSETCKLFEAFMDNIGSDCAVKRRCTAQNCINLIEHACNKPLMAKYALNKIIEILLSDHQTNTIIGILGLLRQLVVIIIKVVSSDSNDIEDSYMNHKTANVSNSEEARAMLEIYDYCLHLISSTPLTQHSVINAALEVINAMLQSLDGITSSDTKNNPQLSQQLLQLMCDKNLKHVNYLRHRGTMKHQIFNLQCFEDDVDKSLNKNATYQASESVTKLFRPSNAKNVATSNSTPTTMDAVSLVSNVSSIKRTDTEIIEIIEESSPDTSKTFPTPSTAVMGENRSLDSADAMSTTNESKHQVWKDRKDTPKRISINPFLKYGSPFREKSDVIPAQLNIDIGTVYDQSLIYYTARLISARFLLTGCQQGLYDDSTIRVSIKSVCLNVIAQCIRLSPEVLEISLKFMPSEKQKQIKYVVEKPRDDIRETNSPLQIPSDTSSNIGQDYEHLDVAGATVDFTEVTRKSSFSKQLDVFRMDDNEAPLLEIIDDYFGKSSTDFSFTQSSSASSPMTRSADPVLITKPADGLKSSPKLKTKKDKLSTSEILGTESKLKGFVHITEAKEDMPPIDVAPPRPPKRTKTFRKTKKETESSENFTPKQTDVRQFLYDNLLFYNHEDPILRAGVQTIIGHYCRSTQAGLVTDSQFNLQYLLAILCMGLQDDIHTVVIQALNTFDKIFPYVMFKYMTTSSATCHYGQQKEQTTYSSSSGIGIKRNNNQQPEFFYSKEEKKSCKNACSLTQTKITETHTAAADADAATRNTSINSKCISRHFNDNDEIIVALLNAFQMQTKFNSHISSSNNNNNNGSSQVLRNDANPNNINMGSNHGDGGGGGVGGLSVADDGGGIDISLSSKHNNVEVHIHECYCCTSSCSPSSTFYCCGSLRFISPKLLLNKLRLCHYNKYWLVQNKYAEVISNLNYASLRSYYGNNYTNINNNIHYHNGDTCTGYSSSSTSSCHSCCPCCCCPGNFTTENVDDVDNADFVCNLENSFIDELLQLIGEDDVRVREHASKCLCRFILQNAKHQPEMSSYSPRSHYTSSSSYDYDNERDVLHKTYSQNLKLLMNFLDYSVFNDMSPALRNLFNSRQQSNHYPGQDTLTSLDSSMKGSTSKASSSTMSSSSLFNMDFPQRADIETVLAKVLYRLTNRLMSLKDKNMQFGIIYCVKYLLKYFPFADYTCAWTEFNFMEIFVKLSQYNYNTAVDLTCQSDLIDVSSKLIVGSLLFQPDVKQNRDVNFVLLKHTIKITNIYHHIFTNQKPLIMAKSQKVDLFSNAKELAITQSMGYFGNEYVYVKLYHTIKSAYDNYKITINEEAGSKLISLLKTCLKTLSVCIEMLPHEPATATTASSVGAGSGSSSGSNVGIGKSATDVNAVLLAGGSTGESISVLKLIEETLPYLTIVINYAPEESIACLRQLLKYLFARNYGNRQQQQQQQQQQKQQQQNLKQDHYPKFIKSYFKAKHKEQPSISKEDGGHTTSTATRLIFANISTPPSPTTIQLSTQRPSVLVNDVAACSGGNGRYSCLTDDYLLLAELFASSLEFHTWKSEHESELSKHIKLFEPLVIYCLTLFLKCNGRVQANILELLVLLLDLNVTYSILDSKNVIFDNIIKSLDIIESGVARNGLYMITPIIKFLIKLSSKSERSLITIPKIISITNNLLANYNIRDVAIQALKTLAYEIFLMTSTMPPPSAAQQTSDTQIESSPLKAATGINKTLKHFLDGDPNSLAAITENLLTLNNELDTQKEVILGMLEKFIESNDCQQVLSLLLLIEQLQQQQQKQQQRQQTLLLSDDANNTTKENSTTSTIVDNSCGSGSGNGRCIEHKVHSQTTCLPNPDTVCNMICQSICSNRLHIHDWNDYYMLETFFKNNTKYLLGNSKEFTSLLKCIIEGDVANFSDLSYATIILSNVILKTEEIYLVNHIKLYLKNHPTIVEKLRQKQQQQQKLQTANPADASQWQMDDKPSTSMAAAAVLAAAATADAADAASQQTLNSSSVINEINYFATVLCEVLLDCLQTILSDHHHRHRHHRNQNNSHSPSCTTSTYSHQFATQYCRLVCHFVKVFHKLCFNSRLEDSSLLASIRFILNACESKLLNEYYNLLTMYSTQGCPTSSTTSATTLPEYDDNSLLHLQLELFQLLNALGILEPLALLQRLQSDDISNHVRRALLQKVCHQSNSSPIDWTAQQVQHLFKGCFLNILIIEQFAFMCNLCEVNEEFCSLFQTMVLQNIKVLNKHAIVYLLRLMEYLCKNREDCSILCFAKFLQILNKLHKLLALTTTSTSSSSSSSSTSTSTSTSNRPLQLQIERLARHLIVDASSMHDKNAIYDTFIHLTEEEEGEQQQQQQQQHQQQSLNEQGISSSSASSYLSEQLQFMILNDLENSFDNQEDDINIPLGSASNIVDEKWIFNQLIKYSAQNYYDPKQIVKILLEIQSENKLQKIFNNGSFDATRILKHSIRSSLQAMLETFRNNCIQYNPHIHYMQPNPLARVSLTRLMTRIVEMMMQQQEELETKQQRQQTTNDDNYKHQATVVKGTAAKTTDDRNNSRATTVTGDENVASYVGIENVIGVINKGDILLPNNMTATITTTNTTTSSFATMIHLCEAVITLMENIKQIEVTALIYIEMKFIDKFLSEHLLRPEHVIALVCFIGWCCQRITAILNRPLIPIPSVPLGHEQRNFVSVALQCIDILLHQKFIWYALNQQQTFVKAMPNASGSCGADESVTGGMGGSASAGTGTGSGSGTGADAGITDTIDSCCSPLTKCELNKIICSLVDVVVMSGSLLLENTIFYRKYKNTLKSSTTTSSNKQQQQQQHRQHKQEPQQQDHRKQEEKEQQQESFDNEAWLTANYNSKAIFLAKLIETKIGNYDKGIWHFGEYFSSPSSSSSASSSLALSNIDTSDLKGINNQFDFISLNVLSSISISSLRFNLFYSVAVTPYEIIQQQQRVQAYQSPTTSPSHKNQSPTSRTPTSNSMLPIIPIESLSDVDILKSFIKRLSIFGFTTRQQFEEYFMTFLLLINKVYDENMVDQQEQFQIRSICLEAIMELLITYKTFPIVGNKLSLYHHTTRWNRINCDSISLKKLHEIQLIISPSNVFYHSNLERNLLVDSVIGTQYFSANQFDLNFIWQLMENSSSSQNPSIDESDLSSSTAIGAADEITAKTSATSSLTPAAKHLSGVAANTAYKNYQYFTKQSGVDYKSSSQLIFDVLMQMIEQNHILILPNLVKFTEICENREQIKQIWDKADYLKSHIPMDDTISHQHLIYLLCKTKGMLIPSHLEMLNLEALIKNYLKSSHLFVRCAALNGLLSLLESYAKTSTTIGKLSDELVRLKDIVLAYIDKHGLIEESPLQCSDVHTKLIWTLNYCLMEWTSKLDPQCNVAFHTKLSASKLLKNCSNEHVYLCCLHGLERMIVLDNKVCSSSGGGGINSADNQNQMLRPSIEKLGLELAKLENEKFSIPALKLLLSCIYVGSSKQLENTELSNGIVQDDPEIIAQQTDKVDILLQCIKTATKEAAWIYGQVLCQMIRDLVPPKEILTKVIKEFLAINQPHSDVIAMIVFQVFRSSIDSSFLQQLQDWLTCSLPTFLLLPEQKAVWSLSVVFLSASINLHLMKLFPLLLSGTTAASATVAAATPAARASSTIRMSFEKLGHHEIALFVTSAQDFYAKLGNEQKLRFREAFKEFHHIKVYNKMLQSL